VGFQFRCVTHTTGASAGRTLAMYPAAYLGHGYRASSMEGMSVRIRTPARSAVSSARRAPSRGGSAFRRVSARTVVPLAAVGGLAALSLATPAAGVSAVTAAEQRLLRRRRQGLLVLAEGVALAGGIGADPFCLDPLGA
jgi:hypothetical protein